MKLGWSISALTGLILLSTGIASFADPPGLKEIGVVNGIPVYSNETGTFFTYLNPNDFKTTNLVTAGSTLNKAVPEMTILDWHGPHLPTTQDAVLKIMLPNGLRDSKIIWDVSCNALDLRPNALRVSQLVPKALVYGTSAGNQSHVGTVFCDPFSNCEIKANELAFCFKARPPGTEGNANLPLAQALTRYKNGEPLEYMPSEKLLEEFPENVVFELAGGKRIRGKRAGFRIDPKSLGINAGSIEDTVILSSAGCGKLKAKLISPKRLSCGKVTWSLKTAGGSVITVILSNKQVQEGLASVLPEEVTEVMTAYAQEPIIKFLNSLSYPVTGLLSTDFEADKFWTPYRDGTPREVFVVAAQELVEKEIVQSELVQINLQHNPLLTKTKTNSQKWLEFKCQFGGMIEASYPGLLKKVTSHINGK